MKLSWRKILLLSAAVALAIYLIISLVFVLKKDKAQTCKSINVQILDDERLNFVTAADVIDIINTENIRVVNVPLNKVPIYKIEQLLASKSFIKTVKVYTDIDGILNIKITQREPVVKIYTTSGTFQMDDEGFVFPPSASYAHYVPIVTGNVPLPFKLPYKGKLPDKPESRYLRDILDFVGFLNQDEFWNSEVEQINLTYDYNVELIPRTGDHIVRLGTFDNYKEKLDKLFVFYKKAMPAVGWDKYAMLDLRFSHQVVATLR